MMGNGTLLAIASLITVCSAQADLTMVEKVEGAGQATNQITILTKGDKMRIDSTPQVSTIVDGKTGEVITLMKDQKCVVRISAAKMKAATEMMTKFTDKNTAAAKLKPTGQKQTINGFATEEYLLDSGTFKASYWVAPAYPKGAAILQELQTLKPEVWSSANPGGPSLRDFPALPIRTIVEMSGMKITTDLVSVKQDPVPVEAFAIPADYQEVKAPELDIPGQAAPAHSP